MASGTVEFEIKLSPKVREMIEGTLFPVLEENKKLKEENARLQVELEQEKNAYSGTRAREITLATECNAAITEVERLRDLVRGYWLHGVHLMAHKIDWASEQAVLDDPNSSEEARASAVAWQRFKVSDILVVIDRIAGLEKNLTEKDKEGDEL